MYVQLSMLMWAPLAATVTTFTTMISHNFLTQTFSLMSTTVCPDGVGPCTPRPMQNWTWTIQSQSIWQVAMPHDLELGIYKAKVEHVDWHGNHYHEYISFEVVDKRPFPFFDRDAFAVLP